MPLVHRCTGYNFSCHKWRNLTFFVVDEKLDKKDTASVKVDLYQIFKPAPSTNHQTARGPPTTHSLQFRRFTALAFRITAYSHRCIYSHPQQLLSTVNSYQILQADRLTGARCQMKITAAKHLQPTMYSRQRFTAVKDSRQSTIYSRQQFIAASLYEKPSPTKASPES